MAKIRIYGDEDVNVAIIEALKRRGVDAWTAREVGNLGLLDEEQLEYASGEEACLFTHDDDFLKIASEWQAQQKEHYGIIFVHQQKLSIGECIGRIKLITDILLAEDMINHIEFL